MLVASLALAIGFAIYELTIREVDLSQTATESQYAIFASDTGAECALYWDFKCTLPNCPQGSAFGTSSSQANIPTSAGLTCAGRDITDPAYRQLTPPAWTANAATTTFNLEITSSGRTYCATVRVAKTTAGGILRTTIISDGYNTCDTANPLRIQRTLQVDY